MWRTTWDDNANWKISVKTRVYERKQLSDIGQQLLWIIETAVNPPSVAEIVDQLMVDGDPLGPRNVIDQRNRVANVLINMRRRGLVCSDKQGGRLLRWSLPNRAPVSQDEPAKPHGPLPICDREWETLRPHIPLPSRRQSSEAKTREFLLAILREAQNDLPLMLTPGQQRRFLAWHTLGVWDQIVEVLKDRLGSADLQSLERKIVGDPL